MNICSYKNCQYKNFLNSKEGSIDYFLDEENADNYCIFHAPQKIKQNFRISQINLFNLLIYEYTNYSIENRVQKIIDFSKTVFTVNNFEHKEKVTFDLDGYDLDFTDAIFMKNVRFDNIKCNELIFKDTHFLDGGGLKNRDKHQNLSIKKLVFRPYVLESDFVIDIGKYISEDGFLQKNEGIIEEIVFENHKIGDGSIFFIGLNKQVQQADFRNMLLDKVYFQNCNLEKCYFLNSKIEKTEFRNCTFPKNKNRQNQLALLPKFTMFMMYLLPILIVVILSIISSQKMPQNEKYLEILTYSVYILSAPFIFIIVFSLLDLLLEIILGFYKGDKLKHLCIADEILIYEKIKVTERTLVVATLESLCSTYSQLKNNFQEKDFQLAGDFFYRQRYTELLVGSSGQKKTIPELYMLNIHHLTNGFGEKFMKPLIWLSVIVMVFMLLFTFKITPNKDYVSTPDTPLFLIQDNNFTAKHFYILDKNSSFKQYIEIEDNARHKKIGYNKKGDYNISSQSILKLAENIEVGFTKSISNFIYPFSFATKKWFQNISRKAVVFSLLESILLWYFSAAFVLALWHRIKRL